MKYVYDTNGNIVDVLSRMDNPEWYVWFIIVIVTWIGISTFFLIREYMEGKGWL